MENKVLIKISPPLWPIFDIELEIIKKELEKKSFVTLITCDGKKKFCIANEKMSKIKCSFCKQKLNKSINFLKGFHKNISTKNEIINYENKKLIKNKLRKISRLDDLKKIKLYDVDFGTSVASSLVTTFKTNNIKLKNHLDLVEELFIQSISSYFFFVKLQNKNFFSKYYIFNGRIYNYRPLLRYGQKRNLNLFCYDYHYFSHDRFLIKKLNFTQNIFLRAQEIYMNSLKSKKSNLNLAREFFNKRFNKKGIGPFAIYNAIHDEKKLPNQFDKNKFIISFFTSSDLETNFLTDNSKRYIYNSQIEAVKKIVDNYSKNKNILFFIRAHPNTAADKIENEKYLKYSNKKRNCFYINPLSQVSSYNLIRKSDLIICFGSTIGIESTFLKKNVINLGPSPYMKFKFDFQPKNHYENLKIINNLIKKNYFKKDKIKKCLIATNAMLNQGVKLKYLKKNDFLSSKYVIGKKTYKIRLISLISYLYYSLFIIERSKNLIKILFLDKRLFFFKLKNYFWRIKQLIS